MSPDAIAALLQTWGYPLWIGLFLASGVGSPITEDVLLLAGGWLLALGVFTWQVALPLGYVAVVATDCIIYSIGRHLRQQTKRGGWLRRAVRPGHLRVATRWFAKYGNWIIFIARLTPGTRLIVYISAGVRGVPLSRFIFYDGLASLIYVPVTLYVGEQLGARIGDVGDAIGLDRRPRAVGAPSRSSASPSGTGGGGGCSGWPRGCSVVTAARPAPPRP